MIRRLGARRATPSAGATRVVRRKKKVYASDSEIVDESQPITAQSSEIMDASQPTQDPDATPQDMKEEAMPDLDPVEDGTFFLPESQQPWYWIDRKFYVFLKIIPVELTIFQILLFLPTPKQIPMPLPC